MGSNATPSRSGIFLRLTLLLHGAFGHYTSSVKTHGLFTVKIKLASQILGKLRSKIQKLYDRINRDDILINYGKVQQIKKQDILMLRYPVRGTWPYSVGTDNVGWDKYLIASNMNNGQVNRCTQLNLWGANRWVKTYTHISHHHMVSVLHIPHHHLRPW